MKQKRFGKKLELNKKTITDLGSSEMNKAKGGVVYSAWSDCDCLTYKTCPTPPPFCIIPVTDIC